MVALHRREINLALPGLDAAPLDGEAEQLHIQCRRTLDVCLEEVPEIYVHDE